jgi:hypothetical protein
LFEKSETPSPDGKQQYILIDGGTLSIDVIPLIPFSTGRRDGRSFRYFPAMADAADLQIELYQEESALKFNKIMGAYSMLAGQGVAPQMDPTGKTVLPVRIGPQRTLYAPPNGNGDSGKWEFVQPDAAVMKFLSDDSDKTINKLRELGRQPLTAQSGNITVITAAAAAGKARSAVGAWALGLKDALEQALVITCKFVSIRDYEPQVSVYTEFDEFAEGKDLEALASARSNGDISRKTYWTELKRRSVLSAEFDADVEEKELLAELPSDGEDKLDPEDPANGPVA